MMRRLVSASRNAGIYAASQQFNQCRFQQVPPRRPLHANDSFLSGSAANYLEDMYLCWQENPASVDPSLARIFQTFDSRPFEQPVLDQPLRVASTVAAPTVATAPGTTGIADCERVVAMAKEYARSGHLVANLDPLNYDEKNRSPEKDLKATIDLSPEKFGFTDLNRTLPLGVLGKLGGIFGEVGTNPTIQATVSRLQKAYCGTVSVEYQHIYDVGPCSYLRASFENGPAAPIKDANGKSLASDAMKTPLTTTDRERILSSLAKGVLFEKYLHQRFKGVKRFGSDGQESMIVGLHALLERASGHGTKEAMLGMAHRGRLSVLCNVAGKPLAELVKEFNKVKAEDTAGFEGQGDVKYHNGWSGTVKTLSGADMAMWLHHNPSHLECVNPLVQGAARAAQFVRGDKKENEVLPIELHGDASFAGQGVVFETMGLAGVGLNNTGGTIHIVVNNQVGFTTDPSMSRSSVQATDIARVFQIPVVHVNGDAPEDVFRVFNLAADYRKEFGRSIIINLVGYRRYGHNESDDPTVTQPCLYSIIKARPDVLELYKKQIAAENSLPAAKVASIIEGEQSALDEAGSDANVAKVNYLAALRRGLPQWKPFQPSEREAVMQPTDVTADALAPVISALKTLKKGFTVHPTLAEIFKRRTLALDKGVGIEWGTAEALAIGTLLQEGTHVRISGQDVERATFSQRHAIVHDQDTDDTYTPLQHISPSQAPFHVQNSTLSEFGVLGFETGYGAYLPNALVMWEAQFADFANGAQIMFDQFLTSGQSKWGQQSNIVISLPHGYDGAGPEHSSGRLERFLQSVSEDDAVSGSLSTVERHFRNNIEIVVPTAPKQYFHVLRRHIKRNFRKPLFVFFSKQFLRAPNVSTIAELTSGGFDPVLDDDSVTAANVTRVVLCTGQLYFALDAARKAANANHVAIVRVEQLAPFPRSEVDAILAKYPKSTQVVWAQDEPRNMGAWSYVEPRLANALDAAGSSAQLRYVGRLSSPSPATGYSAIHAHEQKQICKSALE